MNAIERLHEILAACDGMVTRRFIQGQRELLKKPPAIEDTIQGTVDSTATSPVADDAAMEVSGDDLTSGMGSIAAPAKSPDRRPISVLLLTPKSNDAHSMAKEDVSDGQPRCFGLGDEVADDAIMIIAAPIGVLASLAKLLHWWRFERFSHIYLTASPEGPDITRAKALAVCQRGSLKVTNPITGWLGREDPLLLADVLTQGIAGRRTHLFASEKTAGWESIVGDANWRCGTES
jgi:hypothetical protein